MAVLTTRNQAAAAKGLIAGCCQILHKNQALIDVGSLPEVRSLHAECNGQILIDLQPGYSYPTNGRCRMGIISGGEMDPRSREGSMEYSTAQNHRSLYITIGR